MQLKGTSVCCSYAVCFVVIHSLVRLLFILNIRCWRNSSQESQQDSQCQCTINYSPPHRNGNIIKGLQTYMNVFYVSSKLPVNKLKIDETVFQDKWTPHKKSKYDEIDKTNSTHYSRDTDYLSPKLHIYRLTTACNKTFLCNQKSYKYYCEVFFREFSNSSFQNLGEIYVKIVISYKVIYKISQIQS